MIIPTRFSVKNFHGISPEMHTVFQRQNMLILDNLFSDEACDFLIAEGKKLAEENHNALMDTGRSPAHGNIRDLSYFSHCTESKSIENCGNFYSHIALKTQKNPLTIDDCVHIGHGLHKKSEAFKEFLLQEKISQIRQSLMGKMGKILYSQFNLHQTGQPAQLQSQQEACYIHPSEQANDSLVFWIALSDQDINTACPWVIPGLNPGLNIRDISGGISGDVSGRISGRGLSQMRKDNAKVYYQLDINADTDQKILERLSDRDFSENKRFPIELPAGSMLVMSSHLPYMEGNNRSKSASYSLKFCASTINVSETSWVKQAMYDQ